MSINKIIPVFKGRVLPKKIFDKESLSNEEYEEINDFVSIPIAELNAGHLESYSDVLFWLTPMAFQFYLPVIIAIGVKENLPFLLMNHSLISMLDRSPNESYWDDFFISRWSGFSDAEYDAITEWLFWLSSSKFDGNSLSRSFDSIELLKQHGRYSVQGQ